MQTNLETEISEGTFSSLPPIQERSLSHSEIQELHPYFEAMLNGHAFQVLMLCRYTKTLSVGEFVIGAKGCKHSKSHFVLAHCSCEWIELAKILYFLECVSHLIIDQLHCGQLPWSGTWNTLARIGMDIPFKYGQLLVPLAPFWYLWRASVAVLFMLNIPDILVVH